MKGIGREKPSDGEGLPIGLKFKAAGDGDLDCPIVDERDGVLGGIDDDRGYRVVGAGDGVLGGIDDDRRCRVVGAGDGVLGGIDDDRGCRVVVVGDGVLGAEILIEAGGIGEINDADCGAAKVGEDV